MDRKQTGSMGEEYAKKILTEKGYKIITMNYRTNYGEIDIIAKDKGVWVFVEVKTRKNSKYGSPEEAVTDRKIHHIKRTAYYFIKSNKLEGKKFRIEIVSLIIRSKHVEQCKHIKLE